MLEEFFDVMWIDVTEAFSGLHRVFSPCWLHRLCIGLMCFCLLNSLVKVGLVSNLTRLVLAILVIDIVHELNKWRSSVGVVQAKFRILMAMRLPA